MTTSHALAAVAIERHGEGSLVIIRTDMGVDIRYGPFVNGGVEAAISHLGLTVAVVAMCFHMARHRAEFEPRVTAYLARAMLRDGLNRALSAEILCYLGMSVAMAQSRLVHLLKAVEEALRQHARHDLDCPSRPSPGRALRFRCLACGSERITAQPDWTERPRIA
jgi:hypothetical protein